MDLFIVIPLMLTGYDCVDAIEEQKSQSELEYLRSTLMLVVQGIYNQRKNHYLAEALFRIIRGRMRPQEAALLRGIMTLEEESVHETHDMTQPVRSHWPVTIVKKAEDLNSHLLTNLVENYAHLNINDRPISAERSGYGGPLPSHEFNGEHLLRHVRTTPDAVDVALSLTYIARRAETKQLQISLSKEGGTVVEDNTSKVGLERGTIK